MKNAFIAASEKRAEDLVDTLRRERESHALAYVDKVIIALF